MFSFGTDYCLLSFSATVGVIQLAACKNHLAGLFLVRSRSVTRIVGLVLVICSFVWFFGVTDRNINDTEGGLDANEQTALFLLSVVSALSFTLLVSAMANFNMNPMRVPMRDGLDVLRHSNYFHAMTRNLNPNIERWVYNLSHCRHDQRLASIALTLGSVGLVLVGLGVLWAMGSAGSLPSGAWLVDSAIVTALMDLDEDVLLWINQWISTMRWFDNAIELVVSDYLVTVGMALILVWMWFIGTDTSDRMRNQVGIFVGLMAMGLSSWAVYAINGLYQRPRPFIENDISVLFYFPTDPSFPSNSAAVTSSIAVAIMLANRKIGLVLLVATVMLGFSRVYAGVHYPLDVICGWGIGTVMAFLVYELFERIQPLILLVIRTARMVLLA